MTALNPQIMKSYATGERDYMMKLAFEGARLSYMLLFCLSLPVIMNIDFLLDIWLKEVPPRTASLASLAIVFTLSETLSNPLITVQLATGNIRRYQIIVGGTQLLNVPLSWWLLSMGCGPESVFSVAIGISQICLIERLALLRGMVGLNACQYLKEVYLRAITVSALALAGPLIWRNFLPQSFLNIFAVLLWTLASVAFLGMKRGELKSIIKSL